LHTKGPATEKVRWANVLRLGNLDNVRISVWQKHQQTTQKHNVRSALNTRVTRTVLLQISAN